MLFRFLSVLVFCISSLLLAKSNAGTDLQNGGGGIYKDGHYMTFASAQIPVKQLPEAAQDIPGLQLLLQKTSDLQLTNQTKSVLLSNIYPVKGRAYYRVDAAKYDEKVRQQITDNYTKMMSTPSNEHIVLFAVTDIESNATFLLPEFYQLTEVEQATILLHETAWILNPKQTYEDIVELETSAQLFFQHPQDPQNIFRFYRNVTQVLNDPTALVYAMIKIQYPHGGEMRAVDLLGEDFWECNLRLGTHMPENGFDIHSDSEDCDLTLSEFLLKKIAANKSDILSQALLESYGVNQTERAAGRVLLDTNGISLPRIDEIEREEDLQKYIQGIALDMAPMELTDGSFRLSLYLAGDYLKLTIGRVVFQ